MVKQKPFTEVLSLFKRFIVQRLFSRAPHAEIHSARRAPLPPEKKAELQKLCDQLFKHKKHLTSGKFQFIGLAKIRKRIGNKQWAGLSKIVYEVTEEVIEKHIGRSDIYIRYHDDTYVIIFAHASLEEGRIKAAQIAEEIQRRLFEVDEKELKDMEIRQAIINIRIDFLMSNDFPDFLDDLPWQANTLDFQNIEDESEQTKTQIKIDAIEVEAARYRIKNQTAQDSSAISDILYTYLPFWDVSRGALTTYLCIPYKDKPSKDPLSAHTILYKGLNAPQRVALDIATLKHVMAELNKIESLGRKLIVTCPVHYDTLYNFDEYETYKQILETIPDMQKQFLTFIIMNMSKELPSKNPYWFAGPLRKFCRHVFAEVPLRRDVNFNYLRNTGVDVVGVRLDMSQTSEQDAITILNGMNAKAKALKISKTFVLGVTSLSLTTSSVCAGFDFLCGPAVHENVNEPDEIHQFKYEDLLRNLASN